MVNDKGFQVNLVYPASLQEIEQQYSTKISISKARQKGIVGGYGQHRAWIVSVYVICDVCIHCGELRLRIGNVPKRERCDRHRWADQSQAILLFDATGNTIDAAMKHAGEEAERFNKDPENWHWEIESFLDRNQYLKHRTRLEYEIERLRSENERLRSKLRRVEAI